MGRARLLIESIDYFCFKKQILEMRLKFFMFVMVFLSLTWDDCDGAKGGAKSVINRNRRQRNRGGHGIGGHHGDDFVDRGGGPVTGMGNFDKGPCVGVCYYIKKRGIKLDKKLKERIRRRRAALDFVTKRKKRRKRPKRK